MTIVAALAGTFFILMLACVVASFAVPVRYMDAFARGVFGFFMLTLACMVAIVWMAI